MNSDFSMELLQAINDWQRGGDDKQKRRRGKALKKLSSSLPERLRCTSESCFRQIALDKSAVWNIETEYRISETLSAWTESIEVAKEFKGGVPPVGYQGVIFCISPSCGAVIVNLARLFSDPGFCAFLEENKGEVKDFDKGIGRYGDSQKEVVIEIDTLPLDSLYAWGGYTSPETDLARMFFDAQPTSAQMEWFRSLMAQAGRTPGPWWLSNPEAVARVSEKLKRHGATLKAGQDRA